MKSPNGDDFGMAAIFGSNSLLNNKLLHQDIDEIQNGSYGSDSGAGEIFSREKSQVFCQTINKSELQNE